MKRFISAIICCVLAASFVWTAHGDCDSVIAELKTTLGKRNLKFVQRINISDNFEPNSTKELLEKITVIGLFHRRLTLTEETIANVTEGEDITTYITDYMDLIEEFRARVLNGEDDDQVYKWTTTIGRLYDKGLLVLIDQAKAACYGNETTEAPVYDNEADEAAIFDNETTDATV